MARSVIVLDTGVGNLASVCAALARLGAAPVPTSAPERALRADFVVLPGVGTFAAGMAALRRSELDIALRERVAADRPLLAICLGLQLLASASEESPACAGLGVIDAAAERFPAPARVPQLGWNLVTPTSELGALAAPAHFYFANSYRLTTLPSDWAIATADYCGPFVAAAARGAVLACQFHPELSGSTGMSLLQRWLERGAA